MSEYKLKGSNVVRLKDGALIPLCGGTIEFNEYKKWLELGNTPEPEFSAEEIKAQKIAKINQDAADQITAIAPLYKQSNMLARALELSTQGTLNASEQSELDSIKAVWDSIKLIRNKSNAAIEAL